MTLTQRAIYLSWFTIGYNLIEGLVSIVFGIEDGSVSLLGFGFDSLIEVSSATVVLWRFRAEALSSTMPPIERERRATLLIGILFLVLAVSTALGSVIQLLQGRHPETTLPGLIVSTISLSFMFYLWRAKLIVGKALNSATVIKDAACSLACIKLSGILFTGSLVFLVFPNFWWADSVAALLIAFFIGKEGTETIQAARSKDFSGGCGCSSC
ncbi:MAG TPA: heavy metal transporter [Bdellovibrionales bacterium]|nr:MAG: heavy metal transporter [Bdellovibrionales bacterium GWB1_52_6]OFZ03816.1 MAG: heavy metal transporter [Bdellovibrionales bacterium GWA1_52_35]OFZ39608.1 MAG: heavy metal transporter [Bdellovibrionales bacterium GWC1_52_8]HAR42310.1 heavy metal transporter [Bdellovibrionales bacterium]HCM40903.1 heavy metal transporter [Bdellovibrionales bacterium]